MPVSLEQRSVITQWVLFANSTLATGLFSEASRERETPKLLTSLNQIFESQSFLLGETFTVADVAVGSILAYAKMMLNLDLSDYRAILTYLKRVLERPAFQKTIGKGSS
jgi:glutathione S-transferase